MKYFYMLFITALFIMFIGCSSDDDGYITEVVDYPPDAPQNVYSVTGDGEIILVWDNNNESDLRGYAVYVGYEEEGYYNYIGGTILNYYIFSIENGQTRYFAVAALDEYGNESELSFDTVWDTPRPEGFNRLAYAMFYDDVWSNSDLCGVDFSNYNSSLTQDYDHESNDIFFDIVDGQIYINVYNTDDTDISAYGETEYLTDVDFVYDDTEWDADGYYPVIKDYSYIVWTWDNHFAVIKIEEVFEDKIIYSWAYQLEEGNPQLKASTDGNQKKRAFKPPVKQTGKVFEFVKPKGL